MAQAKRDNNNITTLLAVSNADGTTPVLLWADPTTHRLLVSASNGAFDSLSDVVITSGAQGDIIYNDGTDWVNLGSGTSGQFLKTQGAGADPIWATSSGSGDVVGPGSATDNAIVRFDTNSGKLIQDSVVTIADTTGNIAGVGTLNALTLPSSNFVGLTDTQTLTNKTLTAPIIETSITTDYLTASEIVISDASKKIVSAPVATYPSLTELTYVKGVTSAIQTQINSKGVGDALTTNPLSQFAATTSLQLKGVISDETGSGALVFATSPTFVTPALGTPSALVGTNISGTGASFTAGKATILATARTIAGVSFDGSANISLNNNAITNGAGYTTNTGTLSNLSEDTTPQLGGNLDAQGNDITKLGTLSMTEQAAANGDIAGDGQLWVKTVTPNELWFTDDAGTDREIGKHRFMVQLLDSATDQTTGTSIQGDFRISDRAIKILKVGAYCDTAGTTGVFTVDINEAGTTILSTKITVDTTEKSSETAATASVISDSAIAADAIITFDIDGIQTTAAKGLKVWIDFINI